MSPINEIPDKPEIEGDPYDVATEYIDKLFPFFHDYDEFEIREIIRDSNLNDHQKEVAIHVQDEMEKLLFDIFNYAERKERSFCCSLTNLGRQVKTAGGRSAYLNKLEEEKQSIAIRQELNDKRLIQELINLEFEGKQGQKIRRGSYRIAIITLVLSFIMAIPGSFLVNHFFNKNISNKNSIDSLKSDLNRTNQQIQDLKILIQNKK